MRRQVMTGDRAGADELINTKASPARIAMNGTRLEVCTRKPYGGHAKKSQDDLTVLAMSRWLGPAMDLFGMHPILG